MLLPLVLIECSGNSLFALIASLHFSDNGNDVDDDDDGRGRKRVESVSLCVKMREISLFIQSFISYWTLTINE